MYHVVYCRGFCRGNPRLPTELLTIGYFLYSPKVSIFLFAIFDRVIELFKSNQTGFGVSHVYLECKAKKIFGIACLGKKLVFHTDISTYSLILFSKI